MLLPRGLGRRRSTLGRWLLRGIRILFVVAVVTFILILTLALTGANRSFLLEAESGRVELTFQVSETTWDLPGAVECAPSDFPALPGQADPACGAAFTPVGEARDRTVTWPQDARVAVGRRADGSVIFTALDATEPALPIGTMIVVPTEEWARMGALAFTAETLIGDDMRSGVRGYLRSGRWEARESGLVTSVVRSVTEVVKQGTFASGALVEVLDGDLPAKTYGHIDRSGARDTLSITLISEVGRTALSVRHLGVDGPILIEPDWVDIAVSSPLLLAAAVILSILASASQLFSDVFILGKPRQGDDAAPREGGGADP